MVGPTCLLGFHYGKQGLHSWMCPIEINLDHGFVKPRLNFAYGVGKRALAQFSVLHKKKKPITLEKKWQRFFYWQLPWHFLLTASMALIEISFWQSSPLL